VNWLLVVEPQSRRWRWRSRLGELGTWVGKRVGRRVVYRNEGVRWREGDGEGWSCVEGWEGVQGEMGEETAVEGGEGADELVEVEMGETEVDIRVEVVEVDEGVEKRLLVRAAWWRIGPGVMLPTREGRDMGVEDDEEGDGEDSL
jgi:hypothetical protein